MALYVLDDEYRTVAIIEEFESLIWAERFSSLGDFQLVMYNDRQRSQTLREGSILMIPESRRLMLVEAITEGATTTYSGRSIESILESRVGQTGPMGSQKALVSKLTREGLLLPANPKDEIHRLYDGLGKSNPPSTLPPSTDPAEYADPGWTDLLSPHTRTTSWGELGFRIVRGFDETLPTLFYDNYTGNDLSTQNKTQIFPRLPSAFKNPNFFEVDDMVEVSVNATKSPGFRDMHRPMTHRLADGSPRDIIVENCTAAIVDLPEAVSGKALELTNIQFNSFSWMSGYPEQLSDSWNGPPMWGRRFIASVSVYIPIEDSGAGHVDARSISVYWDVPGVTDTAPKAKAQAPNVAGHHRLVVDFTLPASGNPSGFTTWQMRLNHGSAHADRKIYFYDLVVLEVQADPEIVTATKPTDYFDGGYSPDEDMIAKYDGDDKNSFSRLYGKRLVGVTSSAYCRAIQTSRWGKNGGVGGRLINFGGLAQRVQFGDNVSGLLTAKTNRASLWRRIDQPLAGANADLLGIGRLTLGSSSSGGITNVAGAEEQAVVTSAATGECYLQAGFRDFGQSLYFDILDVDTQQGENITTNRAVVFSENAGTFIAEKTHSDWSRDRNVAAVYRPEGVLWIDSSEPEGLARKVLWVNGSDLDPMRGSIRDQMLALGLQALADRRSRRLVDGTVPPNQAYVYDQDYSLGDLVAVEDRYGRRDVMRVVEQIFVWDAEGFRTYPTLERAPGFTPGEWASSEYSVYWTNADSLGTWYDQP